VFIALVGSRSVANHLVRLSGDEARRGAAAVIESVPRQLRSAAQHDQPARWIADPIGLHRIRAAAIHKLIGLPAETPSLRLLADQTASVLAGMMQALNGLALLVAYPASRVLRRGSLRLRVLDLLPALVNAGRAFAAIGAVALFWIVTEWPSGASAISFTAIMGTRRHLNSGASAALNTMPLEQATRHQSPMLVPTTRHNRIRA
jgi:uncharacterized membrane protein YccC